jgi:hypothetical protein
MERRSILIKLSNYQILDTVINGKAKTEAFILKFTKTSEYEGDGL